MRESTPHHVSHVRCHMSRVICQVSGVRCQVSGVTIFFVVELAGGGSIINEADPVLFLCYFFWFKQKHFFYPINTLVICMSEQVLISWCTGRILLARRSIVVTFSWDCVIDGTVPYGQKHTQDVYDNYK